MAQVHISESELIRDVRAVLEKVQQGTEVLIDRGDRTVAVITQVRGPGRPIDRCIEIAKVCGTGATLDEDFAQDLKDILASRRPLDTSAWD